MPAATSGRSGIRTYASRAGRMRPGKLRTYARLYPRYGLDPQGGTPRWAELFGARTDLHVEIGAGSGEAAVHFAAGNPQAALVAFEVYDPGVASALAGIEAAGLDNVRIVHADARPLLDAWFAAASLAGIAVLFPDPWPKRRHRKRRLVDAGFLGLCARLLRADGVLHFATDWEDYFDQVTGLLAASPQWRIVASGATDAARAGRAQTRFERRALAARSKVQDVRAMPALESRG